MLWMHQNPNLHKMFAEDEWLKNVQVCKYETIFTEKRMFFFGGGVQVLFNSLNTAAWHLLYIFVAHFERRKLHSVKGKKIYFDIIPWHFLRQNIEEEMRNGCLLVQLLQKKQGSEYKYWK